mgnify:FL=1
MNLETSKQIMFLVVFPLGCLYEKSILEALDGSNMHMGIKGFFESHEFVIHFHKNTHISHSMRE